jgi:methyl-accepting chemotaxis protein
MKNLPIILKFFAVMGLFGMFAVGVAIYATSQMHAISASYSHLITGDDAAALWTARANRNLQATQTAIADLEISGTDTQNTAAMNMLTRAESKFTKYLQTAAAAAPEYAGQFKAMNAAAHDVIDNQCSVAVSLGSAAEDQPESVIAQQEYINHCLPKFDALINAVTAETQKISTQANQRDAALQAAVGRSIAVTLAGILIGLFLVVVFGYVAIRAWVISPISLLQAVMVRLSGGDWQTAIPGADRKDEIGGMARAVEVFKQAGLDKLRAEAEAATHRAEAEALRQKSEAERAAAAAETDRVVSQLASGLEKLSAGELQFQLGTPFAHEYEKLRTDFNGAMAKLRETMKSITANTAGVHAGAAEITSASDDLSRRTEQQAAALEQTAAALDEITAAIKKTAISATEARDAVTTAKSEAESSAEVVTQTITAMGGIENSSKQISSIIGVIDEIAFQTNLLALNAGVEAARAGDAGRGFAVVATEVRALAQRSAEAAKEIKALISASGQQVEGGVKLVGETGRALTRIVAQVGKVDALVRSIAHSAHEQATGLDQVNTAVNQMDKVTQQNAAMVEQATAASRSMASEAQDLSRLVAQFSIGQPTAPTPERPKSPKPPPPPKGQFKPAPQPAPAPATATANEWDEF